MTDLSDFRRFLFIIWKHLNLPRPTRRQYALAKYLQEGPDRLVVLAFRGMGKSWILAAFVCWLLFKDPSLNIMVVSASKTRADAFATFVQRLICEVPILHHLRPRENQRSSKVAFDVGPAPASQSPSVYSVGITGQLAGSRADVVIADDVEIPNNSATVMMREKLSEAVKEFDAVLKPGGRVIYLGTPQTEDSLYKQLPERGYEVRIWPVRYPNEAQIAKYGSRLAPDILEDLLKDPSLVGKTTEPSRFNEADLMARETSYGRAGFAMQFMLETDLSDEDRYPLKLGDLMFMPLDPSSGPERVIWSNLPEHILNDPLAYPNVGMGRDRIHRPVILPDTKYLPYQGVVMAIDPSGRGKDETAWAVVAHLNGLLYLLDAGGTTDGYSPETLAKLALTAKAYKVNRVIVEANFGDGMFSQLLKPVMASTHPCLVEEVKHSTQKEKRIADTLEPVMKGHRLVVNSLLLKKDYESTLHLPTEGLQQHRYRLFYQMTRLTRDKGALVSDDRLDALAIAVAFWAGVLAQDVEKAAADERNRRFEAELEDFINHCIGGKPRQDAWVTLRF